MSPHGDYFMSVPAGAMLHLTRWACAEKTWLGVNIFRASRGESHVAITTSSKEHTKALEQNAFILALCVCCRIGCLVREVLFSNAVSVSFAVA